MKYIEELKTYNILKDKLNLNKDTFSFLDVFLKDIESENLKIYHSNKKNIDLKIKLLNELYNKKIIEFNKYYKYHLNEKQKTYSLNIIKTLKKSMINDLTKSKKLLEFHIYKDKNNKIYQYWDLILKNKTYYNKSSLEVIEIFKKELKLKVKNNGSAVRFIRDFMKTNKESKLTKL